MIVSANDLFALHPDADPRQLAMLAINPPTAALLLSEYVDLKPGDWVVQNSANSGVGRWVIAFVRRSESVPNLSGSRPTLATHSPTSIAYCRVVNPREGPARAFAATVPGRT